MGDKRLREDLSNPNYSTLADMGSAYPVIGEMRLVPFSLKTASRLVVATAVPLPPLVIPIEELITRMIQVLL